MKKFIIAFTAIIATLIFLSSPLYMIPIKTYATARCSDISDLEQTPESVLRDLWHTDTVPQNKVELPDSVFDYLNNNMSGIETDDYFLYFISYVRDDYYYSTGITFDDADILFEDNVLTLNNITGHYGNGKGAVMYYDYYKNGGSPNIDSSAITSAVIDFENYTVVLNDGNTYALLNYYRWDVSKMWAVYSNLPDFKSSTNLNVIVDFVPDLEGDIDRKVNGNVSETFYVDITNNSKVPVQVLMSITPLGQDISFIDNTNTYDVDVASAVVAHDSLYNFIWWSDEENYNYDSTIQNSSPHNHHPDWAETFKATHQYSPCPWHYVGVNKTITQYFNWSQINLQKYGSYTVSVYALPLAAGDTMVSRQCVFPDGEHFVDYSTIECVYSSNFTLMNGYTYDQNDKSNGVYNVSGVSGVDANNLGWSSKASVDENGNLSVTNRDLASFMDKHEEKMANYTEAYVSHNWDGTPFGTYTNTSTGSTPSSLKNHFSNFMNFVNYAFTRFPTDIQYLYLYGVVALVVLGIILKVIK